MKAADLASADYDGIVGCAWCRAIIECVVGI
jgi:hypothetical protein